jgi:hypothetical protein
LGAADYTALCDRFHTIAVDGLPIITAETRSQAYRFVTLIDLAYEHRCRCLHPLPPLLLSPSVHSVLDCVLSKGITD